MPAVLQIEDKTGDFNRHYHRSSDTLAHMNLPYWHRQIRALVAGVAALAVPVVPRTPGPSWTSPPAPTAQPTALSSISPSATEPPATASATINPTSVTPPSPPTALPGPATLPATATESRPTPPPASVTPEATRQEFAAGIWLPLVVAR